MIKIGILTYHRAINYGAFLQAVCLCSRLNEESDIEAQIIDFDLLSSQNKYTLNNKHILKRIINLNEQKYKQKQSNAFTRGLRVIKPLLSKETLISNDISEFNNFIKDKYDVIIVGSDEVWKIKKFRGFPNPYFLPGNYSAKKVSYAASARMDYGTLPENQYRQLEDYLNDFDYISVRDKATYDAVSKVVNKEKQMIISCDPSFLYDFDDNDKLSFADILKTKINNNKKNLVLAGIDKRTALIIRKHLGKKYNIISTYTYNIGCINQSDLDPLEWRQLIATADLVITSLFHGVCFSITTSTPFVAIGIPDKKSKLDELLLSTSFESNYIDVGQVKNINWLEYVEKIGNIQEYRDFVLNKRRDFGIFLDRIRQIIYTKNTGE